MKGKPENLLYFIVPGFIGNYQEGFVKNLNEFLLGKGLVTWPVSFRGHNPEEKELSGLDEMVEKIKAEDFLAKKTHPKKLPVVLAHSQGVAVFLRAAIGLKEDFRAVFFAPAIFLDRIILPRVSSEEISSIEKGAKIYCQISQTKRRFLDKKWLDSYRNFNLMVAELGLPGKFLIVRPQEDWLEKENTLFLMDYLPGCDYCEMEGDHAFEPRRAFEKLGEKFFSDKKFRNFFKQEP